MWNYQLLPKTHANLVFLHARRQPFPSFQELAEALQVVWPYGEAACVQAVIERLGERWSGSVSKVEMAIFTPPVQRHSG
jgi:hypothetical protein